MSPVHPPEVRESREAAPIVSAEVQASLLDLVRTALAVATRREDPLALERALESGPGRDQRAAAFVTLTVDGELRGCMGNLDPTRPLRESVAASALSAALDDPRFPRVRSDELPGIEVGVSVLGPASPIADRGTFRPGVDGVIVERGGRRGLLLPEVATEWSWGATEMFTAVCRKAGLPGDAWRDPGTRLFAFQTVRFGGQAVPGAPDGVAARRSR
jgi:AmmeMemoRadiSam system protein A